MIYRVIKCFEEEVNLEKEVRIMIDNTSSTVDAGSLTPQAKASAANLVKTANISELANFLSSASVSLRLVISKKTPTK